MNKILVTGNAGSGKSTLSKKLGIILNMPVYSLDSIVWQKGWKKTPDKEKALRIKELISKDNWIIDGVSMDVFSAADTVIFLDVPRRVSYWRVLKRNWKYLFKSRPELPPDCPEILIIKKLITIIWNFYKNYRPRILKAMEESKNKKIVHIRNNTEMADFLKDIIDLY